MTDWSRLTHAYGTAEDVPGLLGQLGPDLQTLAWGELWSRICHQGTAYSASYAALPALTRKARAWPASGRTGPLILAAAIIASTDRPRGQPDPHVAWPAQLAELAALTEEALRNPGLAGDPVTYVYLLQALLAFEGAGAWGRELVGLNDGEYQVACPRCGAENLIAFGEYGHFSTLDGMYMNHADAGRMPLRAADPQALEGLAARLHARVLADGHPGLADQLTYVFGTAQCAACGTLFRVDEAVTARPG
jgi:hypothetical protein